VQKFLNARASHEIIYTRGTTEAINLVAATYGRANVQAGDEIIVSELEHHSNIVPWQILCQEKGATLRVIPIDDSGELRLDEYDKLLSEKTKIRRCELCLQRAGHHQPGARDHRQSPRRGREGTHRRRTVLGPY
jgi:cysteine desulfurase (EC 2.8.1.7)